MDQALLDEICSIHVDFGGADPTPLVPVPELWAQLCEYSDINSFVAGIFMSLLDLT